MIVSPSQIDFKYSVEDPVALDPAKYPILARHFWRRPVLELPNYPLLIEQLPSVADVSDNSSDREASQ